MPRKSKQSGHARAAGRRNRAGGGAPEAAHGLRIIGGRFRGRKLLYSGEQLIRPMKDRTREAVFNVLGPGVVRAYAIDLFAGTGALGLEALSRGAARATFFERHIPTAALIRRNLAMLGAEDAAKVIAADTFTWFRRPQALELLRSFAAPAAQGAPWLVFSSPPYEFYVSRRAEMLALIEQLVEAAPPHSMIVVEADDRFDFSHLPRPVAWDVRRYPPAYVGILELGG